MSWTALMPSPADPISPLPPEDAFFGLLIETLESLDRTARGQFLQRFFHTIAQLDLTDVQSLEYWDAILTRRQELADTLGRPVSLKTAMVDVLASLNYFRVPILMEYEELKKLQINAATDPLTGLYNRRLFEEYFDKELNRARRFGQSLVLVILDLHRFKEVNDRYGHQRGDVMLQTAASTLRKSLRTSDYAFRIGGDEFALLLPQSDAEQAASLSRRVRANYEAAILPMHVDVALGMDYGLSVYPQDGDQKEVLMRVADERLYQLKHTNHARTAEPSAPVPPPPTPTVSAPPAAPPEAQRDKEKEKEKEKEKPAAPEPPPPPRTGAELRKWERVSLAGTRAYALLGEGPERIARILDLGYGGVALQPDFPDELPETFNAVLHVPILPPVRVSLRRIYTLRREGSVTRVGCSFVS